jgi:hypothetical protein
MSHARPPYVVRFPEYFDDYESEIEAKGYFADLVIETEGVRYKPLFYDTVRFRQEYEDHLADDAIAFSEQNVVVMKTVTRASIEAAVAELARDSFQSLIPEGGRGGSAST